jgi:endonuclease YncB( thermonuclease family)
MNLVCRRARLAAMTKIYSAILAGICCFGAAFPARAAGLPDCAGRVEIHQARVVRVEKNGVLVLSDGRAVLLEGIRLPLDGPLADAALDQLRDVAMAGPLTLTAVRPKEDRYDRVRVQAFGAADDSPWLQMVMLQRGLAEVAIAPDRDECSPDLYEAEQAARQAHAGIWALPAYAIRTAQSVKSAVGRFAIVEGRIAQVERHGSRVFLDFTSDSRRGFAATIAPEDAKPFRDMDPSLQELAGRRVRLRGVVEDYNGQLEISLSNPAQIELLP